MIHLSGLEYILVFIMIFIAGLMDSIAGGGGLISLPTYILIGLPPHLALGTNKFSSCWGTLFATRNYLHHNMIDVKVAVTAAVAALIGSWLGAKTVLMLNPGFVNYLLVVLIPIIAVITYLNKAVGHTDNSASVKMNAKLVYGILFGCVIGFYDGFFGPGTGTFLILFYTFILKYDYVVANGNTKVANLASNLAAVFTFGFGNSIYYKLAIPAALFGILGNLLGSRLVVLKGNRLIRKIFLLVLILLLLRISWNLFSN